jgi:signal transduction histidine kinase
MNLQKFKWIIDLSHSGNLDDKQDDVSRRITFSNVVFIALPVVYLIFMIVDYQSFLQPISSLRFDQLIVPIEMGICFFGLWLNRKGFIHFSRMLFLLTWPFFLHLIPIWLLQTPPDYYLAFPIGMIFHAILIQLMVSHRKEPVLFWSLIIPNFLTTISTGKVLAFFVSEGSQPNEIIYDPYYFLDALLYWLLFNLVMYYILLVVERYIKKVNTSSKLIAKQSSELRVLNQNLEQKVHERTRELEAQYEKLKGYAFYNAHLLRGPFCRIQGLLQLMSMTDKLEEDTLEVMPRLEESVRELEGVIKKIKVIVDQDKVN